MKRLLFLNVVLLLSAIDASAQDGLYFEKRGYTSDFFAETIVEPNQWVPWPTANDAREWQSRLSPGKHAALISNAEQYIGYDWPVGRASVFLDYVQDGNRSRFERLQFARRSALIALVLGELIEGEGRFISDIVDGIWAISEESFWGVPAHLSLQERGTGLPDIDDPVVDLFAAQTAQILAWTSYLLAEQLDAVHPMIRERIYTEVDRRMFRVIESRPSYRWMGATREIDDPTLSYARRSFLERRPNNWNPWISSNLLSCVLLLEKDAGRRAEFVHQVLGYVGNYLEPFPADGGSDEGTGYWGHAAASVFDVYDLLRMATQGAFDEFDKPLIRNMGEFIAKAYIGNGYFINFADASPRGKHSPVLIYRYGKAVGSEVMMSMAAYLAENSGFADAVPRDRSLLRVLPELFYSREVVGAKARAPLGEHHWLPDIQVMTSRDKAGTTDGLYLAAKAGHNEESHNHNDVGSFMVFRDGHPAIVDVGSTTYTRNYGNEWVRESAYHNLLPIIDDQGQMKGRKYAAKEVRFSTAGDAVVFSQDFADAYAMETGLRNWQRTFRHDKGGSITISDSFEFDESPDSVVLPLVVNSVPDISQAGQVMLATGNAAGLAVAYDPEKFDLEFEEIGADDKKVSDRWGGKLYRVLFRLRNPSENGNHEIIIETSDTLTPGGDQSSERGEP